MAGENSGGLAGKRVVLTGASRGIGRACALLLARRGAKVLAAARDEKALDSLARESKSFPGRILPHVCDLSDKESPQALVEAA